MERAELSKQEEAVVKWLGQYQNPSVKIFVWVIFLGTVLVWRKHWGWFTQSWSFAVENAVIWLGFDLAVYLNVKYNPILYRLIQRLSETTQGERPVSPKSYAG